MGACSSSTQAHRTAHKKSFTRSPSVEVPTINYESAAKENVEAPAGNIDAVNKAAASIDHLSNEPANDSQHAQSSGSDDQTTGDGSSSEASEWSQTKFSTHTNKPKIILSTAYNNVLK